MTNARSSHMHRVQRQTAGATLLTAGGLAAAFALASCCALPMMMAALGLGTAWLAGIAGLAAPHRGLLLGIGTVCLFGSALMLVRQQRTAATCGSDGMCVPPVARSLTFAALLLGAGLLWAGYTYA